MDNEKRGRIAILINQIEDLIRSLKSELGSQQDASSENETFKQTLSDSSNELSGNDETSVLYGTFDGEKMVGDDGREYPVPPNYASKSRLVFGDRLKLYFSDGKPRYKPIDLVKRKWTEGVLVQKNDDFYIESGDKLFNVIFASVTYYKVKPGDKVSIIIPEEIESNWATIDSVMPSSS